MSASPLALRRARLALAMGKWRAAASLLRAAVAADPAPPEALALYGYCLARLGEDLEPARDACARAVAMEPHVAEHHACLAVVYDQLGLERMAAASRATALRLDPAQELAREGNGVPASRRRRTAH
jgi:Flp pilus assembly protein TadD